MLKMCKQNVHKIARYAKQYGVGKGRGGVEKKKKTQKKLYPNNHKRPFTQYNDIYIPQIRHPFYMQVLLGWKLPKRSTKLKY